MKDRSGKPLELCEHDVSHSRQNVGDREFKEKFSRHTNKVLMIALLYFSSCNYVRVLGLCRTIGTTSHASEY